MYEFRGVTRGRAGVLVPTLGFYKNRVDRKITNRQKPKLFHASRDSTLCKPYLKPCLVTPMCRIAYLDDDKDHTGEDSHPDPVLLVRYGLHSATEQIQLMDDSNVYFF